MNPRSLRFRLTIWYTAILSLTLAATGFGVWLALRQSIRTTVDENLRGLLQPMRDYIQQESAGRSKEHLRGELEEQASIMPSGAHVRLASVSGVWIYLSPGTEGWDLPLPRRDDLPLSGWGATILVHGKPIRVLSAPVNVGVVQIGIPLDEFEEMVDLFASTMLVGSPVLLGLAFFGGYWLSGRALRPVDELATTADRISAQNLSERLPSRGTGDELDRLAGTLNKMLERLDAAFARITRFTADASHELRTPIAIMQTTAEVTRSRKRSDEEHAKGWEVVLTQTRRMTRLIEDLLMLARADSRSEETASEAIDLTALLGETCDEMQVVAQSAGLQLKRLLLPVCTVFGDAEAIRRIVLIFLDNAIKYTRPGGQVGVELVMEHGTALIRVKDTGIGISSEDLSHIFERFYRASRDRSRRTGGAGLGLTIAQHLARQHGAEIAVESTPGGGSTFSLCLTMLDEVATGSELLQNTRR